MEDKKILIADIRAFIEKYAKISPNYKKEDFDTEFDSDEKYTGPDPYQLLVAAICLENNSKVHYPWSEWGSGCYGRYSDNEGREIHDSLLKRIKVFVN